MVLAWVVIVRCSEASGPLLTAVFHVRVLLVLGVLSPISIKWQKVSWVSCSSGRSCRQADPRRPSRQEPGCPRQPSVPRTLQEHTGNESLVKTNEKLKNHRGPVRKSSTINFRAGVTVTFFIFLTEKWRLNESFQLVMLTFLSSVDDP